MVRKRPKAQNENGPGGLQAQNANGSGASSPDQLDKMKEYRRLRRELQMISLLAIAGVLAFSGSYKSVIPHPLGQSLPVTEGLIVRSAIVRNRRMQFPQGVTTRAQLTYQYSVNGKTYENTDSGSESSDDKLAGAIVTRHPQGSLIQVMYEASDPKTSYMKDEETKAPPLQVALFGLSILAIVVALVLLFRLNRALRKSRKSMPKG